MTIALYGVLILCALIFVAGSAARAVMYAKKPLHLRWELYPVPHEAPHRVKHGGSYFEELDWWKNRGSFNLLGEVSFMVPEMLFLKALHEHNRRLWYRSFPFHFGLYLMMGACGFVLGAALLSLVAPGLASGPLGLALHWVYTVLGVAGAALAIVGALLLLVNRLTDETMKVYSTPGDVFNLLFFLVAFGLLVAGYALRPEGSVGVSELIKGLLALDTGIEVPALFGAGLILCGLLAAYIPMTHMAHYVGKYFTYHSVRWQDHPNRPGGAIEKKLAEYLTYRPTWAAPHVTADGKRTWADVATTNPWEGGKK